MTVSEGIMKSVIKSVSSGIASELSKADADVFCSAGGMRVYIPALVEDDGNGFLKNRLEEPFDNGEVTTSDPVQPEHIIRYVPGEGFLDANNGQQGPHPTAAKSQLDNIAVFGFEGGGFTGDDEEDVYFFGIQKGFESPIKEASYLGVRFARFPGTDDLTSNSANGPNGYADATEDATVTDFEDILNIIGFDFNDPMLDYRDGGVTDDVSGKFLTVSPFSGRGASYPFDANSLLNDPFMYLLRFRGGIDSGDYIIDLYTTFHEDEGIAATVIRLPIDPTQVGRNAIIQAPRIREGRMYGCGLFKPTTPLVDWIATLTEQCVSMVGEDKSLISDLQDAAGSGPVLSPADGVANIAGLRVKSQITDDYVVTVELRNVPATAGKVYAIAVTMKVADSSLLASLVKLFGDALGSNTVVPASTDGFYDIPINNVSGSTGVEKYIYVAWEFDEGEDIFLEDDMFRTGISITLL